MHLLFIKRRPSEPICRDTIPSLNNIHLRSIMQIPTSQKALVYDKPGTISAKLVTLPVPIPGNGQVLVHLQYSGVCHSDLGVMCNSWNSLPEPTPENQVGGHEGIGEVVQLGPNVDNLNIGDRVGIKWIANVCGECEPCHAKSDGLCFNQAISGYYTPGTFQQFVVGPASYVTPIPAELSAPEAAPMLCAGMTVHSALRRARTQPGQWIVVSGAGGGLGHIAVQLASRALGLKVIGIDSGSKKDVVLESGAKHFVEFGAFADSDAMTAHINNLCDGLGAHAVLVCTASNVAYEQAVRLLRFNGTLVCVGIPEGTERLIAGTSPGALIGNQLTVTGSAVGTRDDVDAMLNYAANGIVKTHIRVRPMEALLDVFQEMAEGKLQGRVVLDLA